MVVAAAVEVLVVVAAAVEVAVVVVAVMLTKESGLPNTPFYVVSTKADITAPPLRPSAAPAPRSTGQRQRQVQIWSATAYDSTVPCPTPTSQVINLPVSPSCRRTRQLRHPLAPLKTPPWTQTPVRPPHPASRWSQVWYGKITKTK